MDEKTKKSFEIINEHKDGLRMMLASCQFGADSNYIDAAFCESLVSAVDSLILDYEVNAENLKKLKFPDAFYDFRRKLDDLLFPYCGLFDDLKAFYPLIVRNTLPADCFLMYLNSFLRDFQIKHGFSSLSKMKGGGR